MSEHYVKSFLCLANSRKPQGRCIAGKELDQQGLSGSWFRPVSKRQSGELWHTERRYSNGDEPRLLDIIKLSCEQKRPHPYQFENHIIADAIHWTCQGRMDWQGVLAHADRPPTPIWGNGHSSKYGLNDKIPLSYAAHFCGSLLLIHVQNLRLRVAVEWPDFGARRKVRGWFQVQGCDYVLSVTDPAIEDLFLTEADGTYDLGEALLCLSMSEAFKEHAYKLIAGVILPPGGVERP